jgi:hypothetical protein
MNAEHCKLICHIREFVSGKDISIAKANAIEVGIDDAFPNDEEMHDVVLMLASYRPEGGPFMFGEDAVRAKLAAILTKLSSISEKD